MKYLLVETEIGYYKSIASLLHTPPPPNLQKKEQKQKPSDTATIYPNLGETV
jgi:hypothetical protein